MHRVPIAVLLLLLGSGCASPPADEGLAEHLAALREGSRSLPLARDARGTVVLCMGTRIAVRMDPDATAPEWPWSMAIYDDHVYKGEFEPVERVGDNLLGFLVTQRSGQVVKVGDHAWCKAL